MTVPAVATFFSSMHRTVLPLLRFAPAFYRCHLRAQAFVHVGDNIEFKLVHHTFGSIGL
jgi:hypothetical protein